VDAPDNLPTYINPTEIDWGKYEGVQHPKECRMKIAQEIINMLHVKVLYDDTGMMYLYHGGMYHSMGAEATVKAIIKALLGKINSNTEMREIIDAFIKTNMSTLINRSDVNPDPMKIPMDNGIYDVTNDVLLQYTPDYINTWKLPFEYKDDVDCPNFKKFLNDVARAEDHAVIQEFFGYCLYGSNKYEKALMLLGEGGNGKGVLLSVLQAFLGNGENVTSMKIQQLMGENYYTADLFGKVANVCNDIEKDAIKHTGNLKEIISGDEISARSIYGKPIHFKPRCKLIFSTNAPPKVSDDSDGWHRRWIYLTFPNKFTDELGNKDPDLRSKLINNVELSGVFNWALEGLKRLLKNKKFSYNVSTEIGKAFYQRVSDPLTSFLEDCVSMEDDTELYVPKHILYEIFVQYCKDNKILPLSKIQFGRDLSYSLKGLKSRQRGSDRVTAWIGMTCKGFDSKKRDLDLLNEIRHSEGQQAFDMADYESMKGR
jgi:putative DNA primase/helicase